MKILSSTWVCQWHASHDKYFQAFPPTFHTASDKSWEWKPENEARSIPYNNKKLLYSMTTVNMFEALCKENTVSRVQYTSKLVTGFNAMTQHLQS